MATKKPYSTRHIETRRTCLRAAVASVFSPMLGGSLGGCGSGANSPTTSTSPTPPAPPASVYDSTVGLGTDANGIPIIQIDTNARYIYWNPTHPAAGDANPGTNPNFPKLTLSSAWAALRDGFGDWLLMAQGSISSTGFNNNAVSRSGLSAQYPIVVTTYDPTTPTTPSTFRQGTVTISPIADETVFATGSNGNTTSKLVIENIIFDNNNAAKPNSAVALFTNILGTVSRDTLFHNVKFYRTTVTVQSYAAQGNLLANVVFRHCTFAYAYADCPGHACGAGSPPHAQGLYMSQTSGITIEDCIFYHNGWLTNRDDPVPDGADVFKHSAYFSTLTYNTIFRRNVTGHSSSHGLQARGGGIITDNIFASNPVGVLVGGGDNYNIYRPAGVTYNFDNNVVISSSDIRTGLSRGFGTWFSNTQNGGTANNNLIVNIGPLSTPPSNQWAIRPYDTAQFNLPTYINWTNNIEWNWNYNYGTANYTGNNLAAIIANAAFPGQIFLTRNNNVTHYESPVGSNLQTPTTPFPDPGRTLATFATSAGYANEDALWAAMIANPKTHWAAQIANYIRAGFGR